MTGTDLATRTQETVALLDHPQFLEQVEALLPEDVSLRRFIQIAKTAIRTTPDLVKADQNSLFAAIVKSAQEGLNLDGHEAVLVVFGDKVGYLPMIGGLRKRLADYGWTLKTRVVFSEDDFDYTEEPPVIHHKPVRPGADKGDRIAAYAVATHRDGRRLQIVLDAAEIAKRRAMARSKKVWDDWTDQMWEKSAGHAIEDEIPKAERDRMTLPSDNLDPEAASELLYGPDGTEFTATPVVGDGAALASGGAGQQDEPPAERPTTNEPGGSSPDPDPEPQPAGTVAAEEAVAAIVDLELLAATTVPSGAFAGKTLAEVVDTDDGREWIAWALRNGGRFTADFNDALSAFVVEREKQAA